jgi:hypothetical protein
MTKSYRNKALKISLESCRNSPLFYTAIKNLLCGPNTANLLQRGRKF